MIIQLDIIVFRIPPVDLSFNLVSIVIEDKEIWTKASSEHRTDLLDRLPSASSSKRTYQLQTTISDKQHSPPFLLRFLGGKGGTECSAYGPSD
jgi:hypothetical protein